MLLVEAIDLKFNCKRKTKQKTRELKQFDCWCCFAFNNKCVNPFQCALLIVHNFRIELHFNLVHQEVADGKNERIADCGIANERNKDFECKTVSNMVPYKKIVSISGLFCIQINYLHLLSRHFTD